MAETKKDLVELYIPRTSDNDDPNVFISVNFKSYLIPKGKTTKVPREVAEEYKRSLKARDRFDESVDRLTVKEGV